MAIAGSAFWGPSDAQQLAEGFFPAQGRWNTQQYQDWLARANQYGYNAEAWTPWAAQYFQNVATHGIGTPADAQAYGDWIMPGRQPVIDARTGRLNQIGADYEQTAGGTQDRWGNLGGSIGQNYDATQGDINDVFGGIGRRGEAVHGDVQGNIRDVYGGARGQGRDVYGGLQGRSSGTFGELADWSAGQYEGLQGRAGSRFGGLQDRSTGRYGEMQDTSAGLYGGLQGRSTGRFGELAGRAGDIYGGLRAGNQGAYGTAEETLETLNPAGDAAAARATRAFAPQMASTLGRLRAAGISPNSPEAAAVIRQVEAQRGRAAEDAYTDAARNYVDRSTALTLGEEGINRGLGMAEEEIGRGLGLGELENYQGLGERQLANYLGLGENELRNYQQLGLGEMENYQNLARERGDIGRGLAIQGLTNEQGLAERGLGMDVELGLQGGAAGRAEMLRNLNQNTGLDLERLGQTTGNRNLAFDRSAQWTQGANTLDRDIWGTRADLGREQNAEDLWRYGFNVMQPFQTGQDWLAQQERVKSGAAGPVLNAGNAAAGQAQGAANTAMNFGQQAGQNYGQTIATEAPNAGWGSKMIGGLASAALNMVAPGAGAFLPKFGQGGVQGYGQPPGGGGYPQQGGGYGYGQYGTPYGSGANPYNPMIFGNQPYTPPWQQPQQSPRAAGGGVNYDIVPPGYQVRGRR